MLAGLFVAALVLAVVVFIWYSIVSQGAADFESRRACPICDSTEGCDCVDDAWAYWQQDNADNDNDEDENEEDEDNHRQTSARRF